MLETGFENVVALCCIRKKALGIVIEEFFLKQARSHSDVVFYSSVSTKISNEKQIDVKRFKQASLTKFEGID